MFNLSAQWGVLVLQCSLLCGEKGYAVPFGNSPCEGFRAFLQTHPINGATFIKIAVKDSLSRQHQRQRSQNREERKNEVVGKKGGSQADPPPAPRLASRPRLPLAPTSDQSRRYRLTTRSCSRGCCCWPVDCHLTLKLERWEYQASCGFWLAENYLYQSEVLASLSRELLKE